MVTKSSNLSKISEKKDTGYSEIFINQILYFFFLIGVSESLMWESYALPRVAPLSNFLGNFYFFFIFISKEEIY